VTGITRHAGMQKSYVGIDPAVMERKRIIGIETHAAIDRLLKGTPPTQIIEGAAPYFRAFDLFMLQHNPEVVCSEALVVAPQLKVAGTLDAILRYGFRGETVESVWDWKTTARLDVSVGPQCAGYDILDRAGEEDGMGDVFELVADEDRHRFALWLKPDGTYSVQRYKDFDDYSAFLGAVETYHWRAKRGRL
jgi:hypothetical protein